MKTTIPMKTKSINKLGAKHKKMFKLCLLKMMMIVLVVFKIKKIILNQ